MQAVRDGRLTHRNADTHAPATDETIAAVDINSPSGTGSFDPTVITEAARYDFTVALGSDACDVFATDGACFEADRNQLYALTISQQATCDGEGTGDADATSNLPADGAQSSEADEADNQALNSAVVPDDIAHTAGAVTVSVGSAEASSTGSGAQTATPTSSAAPTTATLIPLPLSSTAPAANAASARAGWSGAAVLAALVLAAAV